MAIDKWNPIGDLIAIQDRMNNLLKDAMNAANLANDRSALAWSPPIDFLETEEAFIVVAELPGLDSEDLDINIEDNVLTLAGGRKAKAAQKKRDYFRHERTMGSFKRYFNLTAPVKASDISANLKNGVLEITVPKSTKNLGKALKIEIKD